MAPTGIGPVRTHWEIPLWVLVAAAAAAPAAAAAAAYIPRSVQREGQCVARERGEGYQRYIHDMAPQMQSAPGRLTIY